MKTLKKVCFDNDYHSIYYNEPITDSKEVEESWGGESFFYYDEHGTSLTPEQAKQYLKVNNE